MDSALTMVEIPTSYYLMTGEGTPAPSDEKRGWFFGLF